MDIYFLAGYLIKTSRIKYLTNIDKYLNLLKCYQQRCQFFFELGYISFELRGKSKYELLIMKHL